MTRPLRDNRRTQWHHAEWAALRDAARADVTLPTSWPDAYDRLAALLNPLYRLDGDGEGGGRVEADAWLREAVSASYGVESLYDLDRTQRAVVFQKLSGVILAAEEDGIPLDLFNGETGNVDGLIYRDGTIVLGGSEAAGRRGLVARLFARYFDGAALDGPPWRLSEIEEDRPSYEEWTAAAEFVS